MSQNYATKAKSYFVVIPEDVFALGPYAVAVYGALRKHADNKSHECFPSHETMAKFAGISVGSVKKALKELRAAGWVSWVPRNAGLKSVNVYTIEVQHPSASHSATNASHHKTNASHDVANDSHHVATGGSHHVTTELRPIELEPDELITSTSLTLVPGDDSEDTPTLIEARRLAEVFSAELTTADVRHRIGKKCVTDLDYMLRLDERTPEQIEGAIKWAVGHHFWGSVIHSPASLRKNFDKMRLQATAERNKPKTKSEMSQDVLDKYIYEEG